MQEDNGDFTWGVLCYDGCTHCENLIENVVQHYLTYKKEL